MIDKIVGIWTFAGMLVVAFLGFGEVAENIAQAWDQPPLIQALGAIFIPIKGAIVALMVWTLWRMTKSCFS